MAFQGIYEFSKFDLWIQCVSFIRVHIYGRWQFYDLHAYYWHTVWSLDFFKKKKKSCNTMKS
jgi:hypothetical protein